MDDSIHMYNDAIVYEGKTVTPVTHLTENNYSRTGYLFAGWNTEPDGSGTAYADKAAIEISGRRIGETGQPGQITIMV